MTFPSSGRSPSSIDPLLTDAQDDVWDLLDKYGCFMKLDPFSGGFRNKSETDSAFLDSCPSMPPIGQDGVLSPQLSPYYYDAAPASVGDSSRTVNPTTHGTITIDCTHPGAVGSCGCMVPGHNEISQSYAGPQESELVKQLCDLTMALHQHLSQTGHASPSTQHGSATMDSSSTSGKDSSLVPANLEFGKLLDMTTELKRLATLLGAIGSGEDNGLPLPSGEDQNQPQREHRATDLVVLSCYLRLDSAYSYALNTLREVQSGGRCLTDAAPYMSCSVTIDGSRFIPCQGFQLGFLIHALEVSQHEVQQTIHELDSKSSDVNARAPPLPQQLC
ncbi:hypothetical protein JX265_001875 [Neoarthrinium moseri]|uniref:Uncharacterized protein n=1 Tax=Neoarthrinium moseri TaxID=1658444 RepID=A0A9P9WVZ0_9PEZI|nr:hypothetical protein JX265_001875 [Neoarthrinium moseri]